MYGISISKILLHSPFFTEQISQQNRKFIIVYLCNKISLRLRQQNFLQISIDILN